MSTEITVTLVCGCRVTWPATASDPPECPEHQERRVRSVQAPKPTFVMRES